MFAIAIDGPAGAGKSTIAKAVAKKLEMHYVDTGALFRTIGLALLSGGVDINDAQAVSEALPSIAVRAQYENGVQEMYLGQERVTDRIRTPEVGNAASVIGVIGAVRDRVLKLERELAERYDVIMDGRDIGTVVLPNAALKIFLTADALERGRRRFLELEEKTPGQQTLAEVIEEVKARDDRDSHRDIAPLKQAEDAVLVDTTHLSLEETLAKVEALARYARA